MAKKSYDIIMLVPEDDPKCGFYYTTKKTSKGMKASIKLRKRKYNPLTKQHEWFVEKRLPSPKAK